MVNDNALNFINSKNPYERILGLTILSAALDAASVGLILPKLFDPHVLVRIAAARALYGTTDPDAIRALFEAADDSNPEVRRACLDSAPAISNSVPSRQNSKKAA